MAEALSSAPISLSPRLTPPSVESAWRAATSRTCGPALPSIRRQARSRAWASSASPRQASGPGSTTACSERASDETHPSRHRADAAASAPRRTAVPSSSPWAHSSYARTTSRSARCFSRRADEEPETRPEEIRAMIDVIHIRAPCATARYPGISHSAPSTNRQSAFAMRICSIERHPTSSSFGLETT